MLGKDETYGGAWNFTPDMWESSVEEPTRPRKVVEDSRAEEKRVRVDLNASAHKVVLEQYPLITGSADDRPFLSPPRKLVKDKSPRIDTTPFPPMYAGDTPTATCPVVNKALEVNDRTDSYQVVPLQDYKSYGAGTDDVVKEEKPKDNSLGGRPPLTAFEQELRRLINRLSMENPSNTPDRILAEYLCSCLAAFDRATEQRERWYGRRTF
jgi:hypothetical protein